MSTGGNILYRLGGGWVATADLAAAVGRPRNVVHRRLTALLRLGLVGRRYRRRLTRGGRQRVAYWRAAA